MLQGWIVIAIALAYIGLLFVVASYGDRVRLLGREGRSRLLIYPLSLAIYCTSWTFFGSVGLASRTGYDFLAIYVGPVLMIAIGSPLIVRVVRLAKSQNITSIADFIAARYGKHQGVAALVALIAIIGTIPYIALQLKAVSSSLATIMGPLATGPGIIQPVFGDIALLVALAMASFAMLFGTRHIDATEHQHGLILAIAAESLIKLVAFLTVGIFVTFVMFDGPTALFAKATEHVQAASILASAPHFGTFAVMTLLSLFAMLLLPRQFHVAVVENNNEDEIRRAAWLFPLYLVLINLFVVPIAIAGLVTFAPDKVDGDMYVLALPLVAGSDVLAIVAFLGGLSAGTAMVIVESVALAIMVSNDILMPMVLKRREAYITGRADIGTLLLAARRLAIFAILLLAYLYYRLAGEAQLASIGLLSFAAVAQLAPAFFGGLIWRRATARGAIAGMSVGILIWAYTLLLPSFADAGLVDPGMLADGPFGLALLRPHTLFGLDLPPLVHGVLWSLSLNVLAYMAFSLARAPAAIERLQADLFVPPDLAPMAPSFLLRRSSVTVAELTTTVARYLGEERTRASLDSFAATRRISLARRGRFSVAAASRPLFALELREQFIGIGALVHGNQGMIAPFAAALLALKATGKAGEDGQVVRRARQAEKGVHVDREIRRDLVDQSEVGRADPRQISLRVHGGVEFGVAGEVSHDGARHADGIAPHDIAAAATVHLWQIDPRLAEEDEARREVVVEGQADSEIKELVPELRGIGRHFEREHQAEREGAAVVAQEIHLEPDGCVAETADGFGRSEGSPADSLLNVALREDLEIHPVGQPEFEIRLAHQQRLQLEPQSIGIVAIQRVVDDIGLDLERARVDGERTVRLARPIRVEWPPILARRRIEDRVLRFVRRGSRRGRGRCLGLVVPGQGRRRHHAKRGEQNGRNESFHGSGKRHGRSSVHFMASNARLSLRTLTRGSPRKPNCGGSIMESTSARSCWVCAALKPRAAATAVICRRAASGEMCGSSPLPEVVSRSDGRPTPAGGLKRCCKSAARSSTAFFSASLVGPALLAALGTVANGVSPAEGRGWKYFASANFCASNSEPTGLPPIEIRLPVARSAKRP